MAEKKKQIIGHVARDENYCHEIKDVALVKSGRVEKVGFGMYRKVR